MWQQIRFLTCAQKADWISDFLLENGALSVELLDADANTPLEAPQFDEPGEVAQLWKNVAILSLWNNTEDFSNAIKQAPEGIFEKNFSFTVKNLPNENWVEKTQAQFQPIEITKDFWIVPTWCNAVPNAKILLTLNPGMAFGTGSHPTTHLCLEWLAQNVKENDRILDYGTGSGILAIAAAKMKAGEIIAVDIDENALIAARQNAMQNHINNITFLNADQKIDGQFDIVVANILANPLRLLAPVLCSHVKENGGALILSGILESQADELIGIYAPFVALSREKAQQSWAILAGRKS